MGTLVSGGVTIPLCRQDRGDIMKRHKIIYWFATGLLSLMMIGVALRFVPNHEGVSTTLYWRFLPI